MKKILKVAAFLAVFAAVNVTAQESGDGAYKVTFDANGGDGVMSAQSFPSGMSRKLEPNKFTFKGAKFLGWSKSKGANTVDYENVSSISVDGNITLYAVWDFKPVSNGSASFYICDHEVTQKEYEQFCDYGGDRFPGRFGFDDSYPAYYVSWYDALVYCNKRSMAEGLTPCYSIKGSTDPNDWGNVPKETSKRWNSVELNMSADGYRLPTEAEWELAAGETPKDPEEEIVVEPEPEKEVASSENGADEKSGENGNNATASQDNAGGEASEAEPAPAPVIKKKSILKKYAWYRANSRFKTHRVGEKLCNENGLYDMLGNVSEWCWDRCGSDHPHAKNGNVAVSTGEEQGSSRVFRGPSWNATQEECMVSERGYLTPAARNMLLGFRVVRSAL
ncbi:MAG: SUMF1/EgtB/PvdO family nonheme iron enzyme [Treponema sp.]|nr:SUMF1/EgtB/PvdO family nonheme iron enzyme [Treponema sp.]